MSRWNCVFAQSVDWAWWYAVWLATNTDWHYFRDGSKKYTITNPTPNLQEESLHLPTVAQATEQKRKQVMAWTVEKPTPARKVSWILTIESCAAHHETILCQKIQHRTQVLIILPAPPIYNTLDYFSSVHVIRSHFFRYLHTGCDTIQQQSLVIPIDSA